MKAIKLPLAVARDLYAALPDGTPPKWKEPRDWTKDPVKLEEGDRVWVCKRELGALIAPHREPTPTEQYRKRLRRNPFLRLKHRRRVKQLARDLKESA